MPADSEHDLYLWVQSKAHLEDLMKIKLTSFETALLSALADAMDERQREILKDQVERFTRVARLIEGLRERRGL